MEYIFVSNDDKQIAIVYGDYSKTNFLNENGISQFILNLGP